MAKDNKLSILSGLMIAVGGSVYMGCRTLGLTWLGAILFAAGLFTICVYGFNLYTGKVGYIAKNFSDFKYIRFVLLVLVFNLISTFVMGLVIAYTYPKIGAEAFNVYVPKLDNPLPKTFISGVMCGLLMFLAVDSWKQKFYIGCFLFVPTFILAGFDHSIANSFYNGAAFGFTLIDQQSQSLGVLRVALDSFDCFSLRNALLVIVTVLGNALGGMIVPMMTRTWKKEPENSSK